MITCEFSEKGGGRLIVDISGHSLTAPQGRDIVCAAISGIATAALRWVQATDVRLVINSLDEQTGHVCIDVTGGKEWSAVWEATLAGCMAVAARNPDAVEIIINGG